MYKRDFAILLVAAFAVYFSIQHEGAFSFRKAWYHHLDEDIALLGDTHVIPPPVVADLNGDGQTEIILATHTGKVQVLSPRAAGRAGDGFAKAAVIATVTLKPEDVEDRLRSAYRPIALRTGYLDPLPTELVRALRKQVVVVVTAGYHILCYDHNLKLLWATDIAEEYPHHHQAPVREIAIHISNHTMRESDRGVVVVGASAELGTADEGEDVLSAELKAEKEAASLAHSAGADEVPTEEELVRRVDLSRHFSYHALDGADGSLRWKHEGTDFHRDTAELAEQVIPQHNYRLDANSLNSRHYGEVSCRDFRESVLHAMPHMWSRLSDTRLQLAHFTRHKQSAGVRKQHLGSKHEAALPGNLSPSPRPGAKPSKRHHGVDESNPVAALVGKVANAALSGGGVGARRSEDEGKPPNVLVAHLQEGIEAVHMYTGRTICKLHLPESGLHVDLNNDGVLDHIQAIGGKPNEARSDTGHQHMPRCWALATSGVPPKEPLFNGSICRYASSFGHGALGGRNYQEMLAPVEVAPPAFLPTPGKHGHIWRSHGLAVFLNSRGEVTAYDPHGTKMWQVQMGVSWTTHASSFGGRSVAPILRALPLRTGAIPSVLLAGGAHAAVVLSEHGHKLDSIEYPAPPILPLITSDFSGDGSTDVILVARTGLYAYMQIRHPGGVPFSALLGCLIVAMAVVYFTQQSATKGRPRKGRSTDRVD
ncbi:hypothetical protein WJX72_006852 [[Myrmecia] bisecta]|uniref:FG-GAP repeat-containing protein n=1 Tax=[Myrmecia] bisecta TaxID=41462 RepID=A0AAW1PDA3_9CHLO